MTREEGQLMKLKEQYYQLKRENNKKIVLLKSGSFYVTFNEDAYIFNYLFSYQVKDEKVGFPIRIIDKVLFDLRNLSLNYFVVDDKTGVVISYDQNEDKAYDKLQNIANQYTNEVQRNQELLEKIKQLIMGNPENYEKIKVFVDEL